MILKRTKKFIMLLSVCLDALGRMSLIMINDLVSITMEILKRTTKSVYVIGTTFFMIVYVIVDMLSRIWNVIVHGEYNIELERGVIDGKKRRSSNNTSSSDD